ENRDFIFQGFVNSGKMDMDVEEGFFNYEAFKFQVSKSNNTRFNVKPLRPEDGNKAITLVSELNGITGEIFVDDPNNRSGRDKKVVGFPKLKSDKAAYIYYNSPSIYKGAYDSTRFYYTLEPFSIDSLDNFIEKSLLLNGELTSAGIFPKFKQSLKILPDYSLGFITDAPAGGFDFYGKEAKYENKIALTGKGLQGSGIIKYLNSESLSKNFAFLPDSTLGYVEFKNKQSETGIQFPEVYGKDVYMTYIPKNNILKVASDLKNDLDFFKGQAKLKGTAILTPKGMEGKGLMNFTNATLISENFKYKCYDILGEKSTFNLRNNNMAENEDKIAFKTEDVSANVSFKERKGVFKSNSGGAEMVFPVNQYKCKMDVFTWYMDKDQIEMESQSKDLAFDSGIDVIAPNFFSTNDRRDTLAFKAPKAKFSLDEKTIYCDEVEYVDVADARVFPSDKKITIRKKAKLDPLSNASIVANYITKYHRFEKAEVDILSRKLYKASGEYPYFDIDSNVTYVKMENIGLDTSNQTVANGKIGEGMNFKLSKEFSFYGDVNILASEPYVRFQGATKIYHECEKFDRSWLSFNASINPRDIQIPVAEQMKNLEGDKISAGIVWRDSPSMDSIRMYPTFLSSLVSGDDPIVLTSYGVIRYDKAKSEYQIASKEKFLNPNERGNILTLNTKTCSMTGSGSIDLGMQLGELETKSYGNVKYDQKTGVVDLKLTMKVKMEIDKKLFEDIGTRIAASPGVSQMDLSTVNLEQTLTQWSDQKTADRFKADYTIKGEVKKMPDPFEDGIVFTGIELRSFEKLEFQERGLITSKKSATLVNCFGQPVFREVDFEAFFMQTFSEISNDKMMLYFGLSGSKIYYLDYTMTKKDGEMRIISSDKDFVSGVNAIKEEKRKAKNFSWGITDQKIYIARFNRLLGRRDE
ncbi:MAG: hypothetical protein KJ941_12745, partial [Bacteroidetes bacterium]|nr:hypothetical protein [Bacteroidota bacterium]